MKEARSWSVYGHGLIGRELTTQLGKPEVSARLRLREQPEYIVRSTGLYGPDGTTQLAPTTDGTTPTEVTFVTIPSDEDGVAARDIILPALDAGGIVVTAEKGAMANHLPEMRDASDNFSRLGAWATVGGGVRPEAVMQTYCVDPANINQLHLSPNGTLTAIFSAIGPRGDAHGISAGQAVEKAIRLGYAEPGNTSPKEVIKAEAEGDIPKKTAILFNLLGLSEELLDWRELKFTLTGDAVRRAITEAKVRRFIVSLHPVNHNDILDTDVVGGFSHTHDGWYISGGFQHVDRNPVLSRLGALTDAENGIVIGLGTNDRDGIYSISGPGAGPPPTVNTMLDNLITLSNDA